MRKPPNKDIVIREDKMTKSLFPLPAGWKYTTLSQIVVPERGITYGIVQPGTHSEGGIPLIRAGDIQNGRIITDELKLVDPAIEASYSRSRLQGEETLLTLVGNVGQSALVPDELIGANVARAVAVIPVLPEPGSRWVNYCLKTPHVQRLMEIWCNTTVQHTLNLKDVDLLPIPIAPMRVREAIVDILGALDDKIELNRKMNRTLEAMAQAFYKHWFVDFGPFQDGGFVESELGEIPVGWEVTRWGLLSTLQYGKRLTGYDGGVGSYPVYGTNGQIGWHTEPLCDYPSVIIGRKGAYRGVEFSDRPFYVIDTAFYLEPRVEINPRWAYYTISRYSINDMDSGSAIPSTSRDDFHRIPVVYPPIEIQKHFSATLAPLWDTQRINTDESRYLTQTRDYLLPKLLSGEIEAGAAEEAVEDAV